MLSIVTPLDQDQWYGKAILSLLKYIPTDTRLTINKSDKGIAFNINDALTLLLKKGTPRYSKKQKRFVSWRTSFSFAVEQFLDKERKASKRIMVMMVCPNGPLVAFDYPDIPSDKAFCYVTSAKSKGRYSVSGLVFCPPKRSTPVRQFWNSILK